MWDYFKPFRRKLGLVTLLLACVVAAGWIRSRSYADCWTIDNGMAGRNFGSSQFGLGYEYFHDSNGSVIPTRTHFSTEDWSKGPLSSLDNMKWDFDACGFRFGEAKTSNKAFQLRTAIIPYWSIVTPLTLLSAWLLLSKSRTRLPKPASEP